MVKLRPTFNNKNGLMADYFTAIWPWWQIVDFLKKMYNVSHILEAPLTLM